jgi:hypothetical protein
MGIFTGIIVGVIILFCIFVAIRFFGKGNVIVSLRGGVPIVEKGGVGKICELIDYEENQMTHKVRLKVNFFGGGMKQTGFWFDPELDFYPSLSQVAWEDYLGTIVCYKDLATGQKDFRNEEVKHITEKFKSLVRLNGVYKNAAQDILNYFEKTKVDKEEEKELFKHSKALNAVKKLASMGEEGINKDDLKGFGMVDE